MGKIQWEHQPEDSTSMTKIKVIGVGGGGCNAVDGMVNKGFGGVEFYAINTDFQALNRSSVQNKIQIGEEVTHGLGSGALPELGEEAARSAEDTIRQALEGADMVFITAGMGGGTGTGAAPVIAEIARSLNILCVAIVTKPFSFEGPKRMRRAYDGIAKLKEHVDTMIVILNDKLMETVGPKTPITEAFEVVNGVLAQAIRAISDLISKPGLINVDFRDVRTIMGETGGAVMGVGVGRGENRSVEAVKKACHSPLQEKIVIDGATGVLINITGGADISMHEINEATSLVYESADPDANIIFGVVIDERMRDEMRVTIIATGFSELPDSDISGFKAQPRLVRPRVSSFASAPEEPKASEPDEGKAEEPDPVPAIQRKREAQSQPAEPMKVDFDSPENPLREWDKPAASPQTPAEPAAQAEPAAHSPHHGQPAQQTYTPQPQSQAPQNHSQPSHISQQPTPQPHEPEEDQPRRSFFSFRDSKPRQEGVDTDTSETGTGGDPYEIPALQRRRKQRFFE